jgi:hypothetical protein
MSEITLKPCPFCGGEPRQMDGSPTIRCWGCGVEVYGYADTPAVKAWNRRIDEEGLEDGAVVVTLQNSREILPMMSKNQLIGTVLGLMDVLDTQVQRINKCVSIIEHFKLAYKTRNGKQIISALAQVFDKEQSEETLQ